MPQKLYYETHGDPKNTALMLVHALGADRRFWEECIPQWKSQFFCITPDMQSAGKTPRPPKPVELPEHAADLEAVRQELGVSKVVVVGTAIGALIAATYAARYPASTSALILTNPGTKTGDAAKDMLRKRVETLRTVGFAPLLPDAIKNAFKNMPEDERYKRHWDRWTSQDPETFARQVEGFIDADTLGDLPKIKCPVLIISGEHDIMMPKESAGLIKDVVPQAETMVMKDVAHFIPYQAPDRFAPMLTEFVRRVVR